MTTKEKYEKAYQDSLKGKSLTQAAADLGFQLSGTYYNWMKKAHPEHEYRTYKRKSKKAKPVKVAKVKKTARPYVQEIPAVTPQSAEGKIICIIGSEEQIKNILKGLI